MTPDLRSTVLTPLYRLTLFILLFLGAHAQGAVPELRATYRLTSSQGFKYRVETSRFVLSLTLIRLCLITVLPS